MPFLDRLRDRLTNLAFLLRPGHGAILSRVMSRMLWLTALGGGFMLLSPAVAGAVVLPESSEALVVAVRDSALGLPGADRWPDLATELEPFSGSRDEPVAPLLLTLAAASLLPIGLLWQSWRTGTRVHGERLGRD